jgi:uncharacterized membrane protein YiaA
MKKKTKTILGVMTIFIGLIILVVTLLNSLGRSPAAVVTGSIFVIMLVAVAINSNREKLGNKIGGLKLWQSSKDLVITLCVVAVGLVFANWLCSEVGWHWWKVNHQNTALFWVTQFAVLFAFIAPMIKNNNRITFIAWGVLLVVIWGWVDTARGSLGGIFENSVKVSDVAPYIVDKPIFCKAGVATERFYIMDRNLTLPGYVDIVAITDDGVRTVFQLTEAHPEIPDFHASVVRMILPMDYVTVTRPKKPQTSI